jgi:hypothetical protein
LGESEPRATIKVDEQFDEHDIHFVVLARPSVVGSVVNLSILSMKFTVLSLTSRTYRLALPSFHSFVSARRSLNLRRHEYERMFGTLMKPIVRNTWKAPSSQKRETDLVSSQRIVPETESRLGCRFTAANSGISRRSKHSHKVSSGCRIHSQRL